ncbi:DUF536 domain-containing protein [Macrococcus sp. FSL R5-0951]|uniref:DUF536 domain-containing protein n=1 Tax=Macrococcoides caseolyticum TaxID=69966 RepID=UPI0024BBF468|nr:DUF536 domain-containing protein [Macrococcus caseolyticus]MDJ1092086.1 DUF536 domain-containing protein [Macrococcus caseolyticus]
MNYSLKELSERFSVTKMTVLNHAKRLNLELEKVDNALVITDEQALKIGESINNQKPLDEKINLKMIFDMDNQEDEQPTQKEEAKDKVLQDDIINLLKQQLNDKEKQISFLENQMNVKDIQINKLNETLDNQQKLLHNQQALALESNDRIKALEVKLKENDKRQDKDGKDQLYVETETQRADMKENKVDDFYKDLREDAPKGFFSKFFRR